jgi:hypothetical protein
VPINDDSHEGFERKDGEPIEIRFNVENLFDLNYWTSADDGLAMGTLHIVLLSVCMGANR